jgi:hypothetical protein
MKISRVDKGSPYCEVGLTVNWFSDSSGFCLHLMFFKWRLTFGNKFKFLVDEIGVK